MKAVICPVCGGLGKHNGKECHGCKGIGGEGKGWVEVNEEQPVYPYLPYPYPYYPYNPYYPYTTITWPIATY